MISLDRLYEKQYEFELEQRNTFSPKANIPIVAITVVGTANSTMIVGFTYSWTNSYTLYFSFLMVFSALSILLSLYFLIKCMLFRVYEKLPTPDTLEVYRQDILEFYKEEQTDENAVEDLVEKEMKDLINEKYREAVILNSETNIDRGNLLDVSTLFVAVALLLTIFATPLYLYGKAAAPAQIHEIKIHSPR